MGIRIEVGDKWVITSDQYQFIPNEKKVAQSGKNWRGVARHYRILPEDESAYFWADSSPYSAVINYHS